ncbi:hypothetical protein [Corynebacterium sp.]|uniref:hypothetical protein n=1 Tax=Corynebacterium sp. TaxID=1720 RepID=UPI0026DAB481|nr:hypothetical protein [Corynebacterium sp.]MDO5077506.1 hypothetical protein [Corynebacterium sp.]
MITPEEHFSAALPVRIPAAQAAQLAEDAWRQPLPVADPMLTYFPLFGVVFEVQADGLFAGPAKSLQGRQYQVVVDRSSSTPLITAWEAAELLPEIPLPQELDGVCVQLVAPENPAWRATEQQAINIAHRAVVTVLLRRLKLGAQFQLRCVQSVWPLWKPNWRFTTSSVRALVDARNGNVVFQR